jgi:hypothetical protein
LQFGANSEIIFFSEVNMKGCLLRAAATIALFIALYAPAFARRSVDSPVALRNCIQTGATAPVNWQKIDVAGALTLRLPPDMKGNDVRGIESSFREYKNESMQVQVIYEPYDHLAYDERHPEDAKDYQEKVLTIGGKRATCYAYHHTALNHEEYLAELYVGDWENNRVEAIISVKGVDARVFTIASQIFGSVTFHSQMHPTGSRASKRFR